MKELAKRDLDQDHSQIKEVETIEIKNLLEILAAEITITNQLITSIILQESMGSA
jgi:hypothetical protein